MDFRSFIDKLSNDNIIISLSKEVDLDLELGAVINAAKREPLLFKNLKGFSGWRIASNIFASRDLVAEYFGITKNKLISKMLNAIKNPSLPDVIPLESSPIYENVVNEPDLSKLPIPKFTARDGGKYIASGVIIAWDDEYGFNSSFHRMMVVDKDKVVARILDRDLNLYHNRSKNGRLNIAIVIGAPINLLLASAISVGSNIDELQIANSLMPYSLTTLPNGIVVPAGAEIVMEGVLTNERTDEGPFVDLTNTYDIIRRERIIEIKRIYHRNNPYMHVLLPGGFEHKVLMGMPREPTIYNEVNKVVTCKGVNLTPGGCSWLHAVISIIREEDTDIKSVIDAAFEGHKSLKHLIIVNDDIDVYDPFDVEWAIATRFQASRDMYIFKNQKGSSLDPSADPNSRITTKVAIDASIKPSEYKHFERVSYKKVNFKDYI